MKAKVRISQKKQTNKQNWNKIVRLAACPVAMSSTSPASPPGSKLTMTAPSAGCHAFWSGWCHIKIKSLKPTTIVLICSEDEMLVQVPCIRTKHIASLLDPGFQVHAKTNFVIKVTWKKFPLNTCPISGGVEGPPQPPPPDLPNHLK